MVENVRVQGLKELGDTLRRLPAELASKNGGPLRAALFQALKPIRDEARARAPVHEGSIGKKRDARQPPGTLKKNIIAKREQRPEQSGMTELYHITVRSGRNRKLGDAFYWRWVEFGHLYVPPFRRRKKVEEFGPRGGVRSKRVGSTIRAQRADAAAKGVRVAPRPFLRPAFETKKNEALARFKTSFASGIARAVKKAGGK